MSYLKRNLLTIFLFLSFPILSDINKNPFELIDTKSQEMVVVLTTENELFNTNPELFKDKRIDKITLQIEKLEIMKDCSSVGIQISKKRSHDQL